MANDNGGVSGGDFIGWGSGLSVSSDANYLYGYIVLGFTISVHELTIY